MRHDRSGKEQVVANLFASTSTSAVGEAKKKILIEEVGEGTEKSTSGGSGGDSGTDQHTPTPPVSVPVPLDDEGPSLMEQMMAAQQQAKKKEDVVKVRGKVLTFSPHPCFPSPLSWPCFPLISIYLFLSLSLFLSLALSRCDLISLSLSRGMVSSGEGGGKGGEEGIGGRIQKR